MKNKILLTLGLLASALSAGAASVTLTPSPASRVRLGAVKTANKIVVKYRLEFEPAKAR